MKGRKQTMKGAVFDIDGTLLDSMDIWWRACSKFFKNHGLTLSDEQAVQVKEMRLEDSLPMIIERYGIKATPLDAINEMKTTVAEAYINTVRFKPYAKEYLELLKSKGVKIAVATSGYKELCTAAFKRLGAIDLIDEYAFSNEVNADKSNPDIYLLAAKKIGCKPEECTVFEDITAGIQGARSGGFTTCAVYDPTNEYDTEILKELSDMYITSWKELL